MSTYTQHLIRSHHSSLTFSSHKVKINPEELNYISSLQGPGIEFLSFLPAGYTNQIHYITNNVMIHYVKKTGSGLCNPDPVMQSAFISWCLQFRFRCTRNTRYVNTFASQLDVKCFTPAFWTCLVFHCVILQSIM